MQERPKHSSSDDGIDRRGFLKCMAWAGTGVLWTVRGGLLSSRAFGASQTRADELRHADFSFVQLSDSHIGFAREPNKDVTKTFQIALDRIVALKARPELILHTGDLTHLSKPAEFDTLAQMIRGANLPQTFYVPGEHDMFSDDGKQYLERFGKGTRGLGWQSFDHRGVHFVGMVNVANLKPGGLGVLGAEQLEWFKRDLEALSNDTPIVVYAHVPLWPSIRNGVGRPKTASRRSRCSDASRRSPC
jgi:3',5'-cyclic AMP phosphodiesterase CpdA